jgi:hypothetical protein
VIGVAVGADVRAAAVAATAASATAEASRMSPARELSRLIFDSFIVCRREAARG